MVIFTKGSVTASTTEGVMHTNRKMVGSIIREVSPYKGDGSPLYRAEEIGEGTPGGHQERCPHGDKVSPTGG